jgi:pantoate--beta-alanine ligase
MGALHQGHISLIDKSLSQCDLTVCSIFVNPTQFNDKTDYDKYPITIGKDIEKLSDSGCQVLFLPDVKEMYPEGFENKEKIDFGFLAQTLEGEHRPGHFDGMAQVVEKLLNAVEPDFLYMGQKDYQQQLIVKELIKKRGFKAKLVMCPTLREKDGLAMSSRNMRLDPLSRKIALEISKTLEEAKRKVQKAEESLETIQQWGLDNLSSFKEIEAEYFQIRNAKNLDPVKSGTKKLVALTAVKIGGVRLIDNMLLN